jgi:2-octaprenyl-6-methoxyphenol hydroxylase
MQIKSAKEHYDIVVVGGGMVGASFACALDRATAGKKLSILVVEAFALSSGPPIQPSFDARSTALSFGSSKILESAGLWADLLEVVTPIKQIHVSDKGHFGSVMLNHEESKIDALGYVVENSQLGVVLSKAMESSSTVELLCPARIESVKPLAAGMKLAIATDETNFIVETSLVVLADGGKSPICSQLGISHYTETYEQHALIANISFENSHEYIAYERFTDTGPLAVLPLPKLENENRASLVWTVVNEQVEELKGLAEKDLLERLQERFGNRLGKIRKIGERVFYPLGLSTAKEQIRPGLVLLGNVAHTLHPVAGQGLNLALRDIESLVNALLSYRTKNSQEIFELEKPLDLSRNNSEIGSMQHLQEYLRLQESDQAKTIMFTDKITKLFSNNDKVKIWARKFGLLSIEMTPSLKREFSEQAMGLRNN